MGDNNDVIVQRSIMTRNIEGYDKYVNTDVLRQFIDKHGVDYRDRYHDNLLNHCTAMPLSHIDLVLSYNPKYVKDDGTVENFGFFGFKSVYLLKKILERDDQFLYVTRHVDALVPQCHKPGGTYLDYLRRISKIDCLATEDGFKCGNLMMLLLENHEKKYYRLFDLLMPLINDDNNNKKRRVY